MVSSRLNKHPYLTGKQSWLWVLSLERQPSLPSGHNSASTIPSSQQLCRQLVLMSSVLLVPVSVHGHLDFLPTTHNLPWTICNLTLDPPHMITSRLLSGTSSGLSPWALVSIRQGVVAVGSGWPLTILSHYNSSCVSQLPCTHCLQTRWPRHVSWGF